MTRIKEARLQTGLTQQEISDLIKIPKRTLENYEQGSRNPAPWIENLLIKEIKSLEGKDNMLVKIKRALEKESMRTGKMGTETVTVKMELSSKEKEQFLHETSDQLDDHYDWQFDGNTLFVDFTEEI